MARRKEFVPEQAYSQAKLANLLTSYELVRRLNDPQIHVNVADPLGAADTDMAKKGNNSRTLMKRIRMSLLSLVLTSKRAARSSIYLASSPDVENFTGKYVDSHCRIVASSPLSYDEATAEKVWRVSDELTDQSKSRVHQERVGKTHDRFDLRDHLIVKEKHGVACFAVPGIGHQLC